MGAWYYIPKSESNAEAMGWVARMEDGEIGQWAHQPLPWPRERCERAIALLSRANELAQLHEEHGIYTAPELSAVNDQVRSIRSETMRAGDY